ncbi:MAG: four helix bundle protein, partial [Pirellulaceae bacterium]
MRAAQSIPLNIAEGNGKQSLKDTRIDFSRSRAAQLWNALRFTT